MTEQIANNASSTLNGTINSSTTSIVVTSASGFPTSGNFRIIIGGELMKVTGVSGTTFTVERGSEGTGATSHATGSQVTHIITRASMLALISENAPGGYLPSATPSLSLASSNFTQINTSDFTITDSTGKITIRGAAHNNTHDVLVCHRAMTTTVTVAFTLTALSSGAFAGPRFGIGLYHTGQNKFESYYVKLDGSEGIKTGAFRWDDATTANGAVLSDLAATPSDVYWLRVHDDGTDFVYSFSNDGVEFLEAWRHVKSQFFSATPDRVCFIAENLNNTDREMVATVLGWTE